jgi:hypothetical protein
MGGTVTAPTSFGKPKKSFSVKKRRTLFSVLGQITDRDMQLLLQLYEHKVLITHQVYELSPLITVPGSVCPSCTTEECWTGSVHPGVPAPSPTTTSSMTAAPNSWPDTSGAGTQLGSIGNGLKRTSATCVGRLYNGPGRNRRR